MKERKPNVQTTVNEQYEKEEIRFLDKLFEREYAFEIQGQIVERSYEDRNVYFNFKETESGWLNGEQSIELGMKFIEHGKKALLANMINHQCIHCYNTLHRYIRKNRVENIILKMINDNPPNYGRGFKTFRIIPVWKERKIPEYAENFCFDDVIYFSPFQDEYNQQIEEFKVPIKFEGYDHQKEVEEFQKEVEKFV